MPKINGALLTARIGGLYTADSIRKQNFHFQGKRFLSELAVELGLLSAGGHVEVVNKKSTESGSLHYKVPGLEITLFENPNTRNGVVFSYSIFGPDGSLVKQFESFFTSIEKQKSLDRIVDDIKSHLASSRANLH